MYDTYVTLAHFVASTHLVHANPYSVNCAAQWSEHPTRYSNALEEQGDKRHHSQSQNEYFILL